MSWLTGEAAPFYLALDIVHTIVRSLISRTLHIVLKPGDRPPASTVTHPRLVQRIRIEPLDASLAHDGPLTLGLTWDEGAHSHTRCVGRWRCLGVHGDEYVSSFGYSSM